MVIPQWLDGTPALAYRCGGSTGIEPDHPIGPSPVSRLTPPVEAARHLEHADSIYACTALTHDAGFPYSQVMDLDLKGLEERVAQLIELSHRLRAENGSLRQQLVVAHNENKQLGERMEAARQRVEALLERVPAAVPRESE
jgi:cell division protein ZapB